MPRIWLIYFQIFLHPLCPPTLSRTHARRTFDRALRTLPASLHLRVWKVYLRWAEQVGGETCLKVWRRYVRVDPSLTERYVMTLLAKPKKPSASSEEDGEDNEEDEDEDEDELDEESAPRALEAAKLLLSLARRANDGTYISPDSKSPYNLLVEWLELCEKYPDAVGMTIEEEEEFAALTKQASESTQNGTDSKEAKSTDGNAPRGRGRGRGGRGRGGASTRGGHASSTASTGKALPSLSSQTDPLDPSSLPVGQIIRTDGLSKFPDQAGRLWTGLATYWIKRGELDAAKATFEEGMGSVVTVRDFTQIFDAYAETSEQVISFLMDDLSSEEGEEDEEGQTREEKEQELDERMKDFEELMERRPFLVNDVLIRRNPDDVQEWEKRVVLHGEDDEKVSFDKTRRKGEAERSMLILNSSESFRSSKHIAKPSKPLILEKLPEIIINFSSILLDSTRMEAPLVAERQLLLQAM